MRVAHLLRLTTRGPCFGHLWHPVLKQMPGTSHHIYQPDMKSLPWQTYSQDARCIGAQTTINALSSRHTLCCIDLFTQHNTTVLMSQCPQSITLSFKLLAKRSSASLDSNLAHQLN